MGEWRGEPVKYGWWRVEGGEWRMNDGRVEGKASKIWMVESGRWRVKDE